MQRITTTKFTLLYLNPSKFKVKKNNNKKSMHSLKASRINEATVKLIAKHLKFAILFLGWETFHMNNIMHYQKKKYTKIRWEALTYTLHTIYHSLIN